MQDPMVVAFLLGMGSGMILGYLLRGWLRPIGRVLRRVLFRPRLLRRDLPDTLERLQE